MSLAGSAGRWLAHEAAAEVTQPYVERGARMIVGAWSARDHARDAYTGLEAIRQDGRRGDHTVSAGEWFHGLSDRQNALGQLQADFEALHGDLTLHATHPDDASWVIATVVPTLKEWQAFYAKQDGNALSPWVTEWSVFLQWQERLNLLRDLARSRGIQLDSATPIPLPMTVWERSRSGTGGGLDPIFGLAKTVLFGVIALTGIVGFLAIAREVHKVFRKE